MQQTPEFVQKTLTWNGNAAASGKAGVCLHCVAAVWRGEQLVQAAFDFQSAALLHPINIDVFELFVLSIVFSPAHKVTTNAVME